jgi:putative ABC transport system permease protein
MLLMLAFAISSAVLATAGVFGVTARAIALQSRDMGIRLALGAREGKLVGFAMRSSLVTGILGAAFGLRGALWLTRLLSRFLFGIENTDVTTYAAAASLLVVLSLLGSYLAARRIARIDPVEVLRLE